MNGGDERLLPLKTYTTEDDATFSIGRALYAKRFDLTVDKDVCKGCDICVAVCPREAVTLRPLPKGDDGDARAPEVRVDVDQCDYHGACAVTCPFGAITVTVNGTSSLPIVEKDAYPELIRDIQVDDARCDLDCNVCEDACPLDAITVRFEPLTDEELATRGIEVANGTARPRKPVVEVDTALCACCKICEDACPPRVITVTKFINGTITIDPEQCPEGCKDCLDVCPVDALAVDDDGKVYPKDRNCIYCRACVTVCPQPEALEVTRTSIRHAPIKSGAWNTALEKLTSVAGVKKEYRAKRTDKAMEAIRNLER
jgi:4Fe-4S ferredoxin